MGARLLSDTEVKPFRADATAIYRPQGNASIAGM